MTRYYRMAHREPRTLGEAWDEARSRPWETARDFAVLVLVFLALVALYVLLWGMQP